ncbi:MAG TPA: FeoA family protein [Cytophagales bacterium]|nr:FeoA family protein [Cytophagales bacterium]
MKKTLSDLKIGEKAKVLSYKNDELSVRLIEMGCVPGCEVRMKHIAPLGGPMCFCINGSDLSIGKEEASLVDVETKTNV